jgi:hypothetical protein
MPPIGREKSFFFDGELSQEHNGWRDLLCLRYNLPNLKNEEGGGRGGNKGLVQFERAIRRLAAVRS